MASDGDDGDDRDDRDEEDEGRRLSLEDTLGTAGPAADDGEPAAPAEAAEPAEAAKAAEGATPAEAASGGEAADSAADAGDWQATPAFEFDPRQQRDVYVRADEWQTFEFAKKKADMLLAERGIEEVAGRELDTAAAAVAADNPEAWADAVEDARKD